MAGGGTRIFVMKSMEQQNNTDLKSSSGFNPWLEIWTEPRTTISRVVAENPNRSLVLLASIYGFSSLLNSFQTFILGHQIGLVQIYLLAALLSPIWGYIGFSVWSFFVSVTGKIFRGAGSFKEIRAAYAWSCVPLIINMVLWLVMGACFGRALFMTMENGQPLSQMEVILLFGVLVARLVTMIWSLVIYVNTLSEVQKFSVLKAIGNLLVAGLCVGVVCYLLLLLGAQSFGGMSAAIPQAQIFEHVLTWAPSPEILR